MMRELMRELNEKLIDSGNWAPHPFIENGLVEIRRVERLIELGFEFGHEPNDVFCLWYSSSENEKATGESGFEFGGVEL